MFETCKHIWHLFLLGILPCTIDSQFTFGSKSQFENHCSKFYWLWLSDRAHVLHTTGPGSVPGRSDCIRQLHMHSPAYLPHIIYLLFNVFNYFIYTLSFSTVRTQNRLHYSLFCFYPHNYITESKANKPMIYLGYLRREITIHRHHVDTVSCKDSHVISNWNVWLRRVGEVPHPYNPVLNELAGIFISNKWLAFLFT